MVNRWKSFDQETVHVGSINSFKGRLDKIRKTRVGFLWTLHGPLNPKPHGDKTLVRPHKVSYKVSYAAYEYYANIEQTMSGSINVNRVHMKTLLCFLYVTLLIFKFSRVIKRYG